MQQSSFTFFLSHASSHALWHLHTVAKAAGRPVNWRILLSRSAGNEWNAVVGASDALEVSPSSLRLAALRGAHFLPLTITVRALP